ncbi:MAG: histidine phosphatase family protein [Nanoarchaeota archaeon]|nr:histidine phosphatase family protein [Nanoarchaeota archaeon]
MRLILVRHGETHENKKEIWQGHHQGMLNEEGREQARKLIKRLEKEKIDIIYCSDLERTRDTIQPFLEKYGVPVYYVEALRERNLGLLEGMKNEDVKKYLKKHNLDLTSDLESGESYDDVRKRLSDFYYKTLDKHEGETVLFVTHGGSIAQLITCLLGYPKAEFRNYVPKNTGVSEIRAKKGKPELILFDDISHL